MIQLAAFRRWDTVYEDPSLFMSLLYVVVLQSWPRHRNCFLYLATVHIFLVIKHCWEHFKILAQFSKTVVTYSQA